jgi:hypothetical protein
MVKRRASIFNINLFYRPQDTISGKMGWIVSWITESGNDGEILPETKERNFGQNREEAEDFLKMRIGL